MKSMTGYGSTTVLGPRGRYAIELRSVNHRYLSVRTHLPRELAHLEMEIQRLIGRRVQRGTVDVRISLERSSTRSARLTVNRDLMDEYVKAFEVARQQYGWTTALDPNRLLGLSDIFHLEEETVDAEAEWQALQSGFEQALDALDRMRETEGQTLSADLAMRLAQLESASREVAALHTAAQQARFEKLKEGVERLIEQLGAESARFEPGRLEAEAVLLVQRADITEEQTRLASHIGHFRELMRKDAPAGKTLDFLLQEMGREVNTTASKSSSAPVNQIVVGMKASLEQIREQVQNIE